MTQKISPASPRRMLAAEFGAHLRRAIARKHMPKKQLARDAGVARSAIANYLAALNLPTMQTATRLAEILEAPGLLDVMARSREYVCPIDGRRFVFNGQGPRRYCSVECQRIAEKQREGTTVTKRADRAERRVWIFQSAVDAMCRSCEPEGRCRDAACPLRPVSPLPIVQDLGRTG